MKIRVPAPIPDRIETHGKLLPYFIPFSPTLARLRDIPPAPYLRQSFRCPDASLGVITTFRSD
jgi:hypothetical protein